MNALKALELELSIAKSNERIYLNQIEKLNGYEYGVNYFDSRHKQEIEVDKKRFADKLKNTQSQIKRLHSIKQALTRPLDSEVEEALKRMKKNNVFYQDEDEQAHWQVVADDIKLRKALRLQPQRTKQEYIDEIIHGLNNNLSNKNKYYNNWWTYEDGMFKNIGIHKTINITKNETIIGISNKPLQLAKLIIDFFTEYGDKE